MKHELAVTNLLIAIFFLSQIVGLFVLTYDANILVTDNGLSVDYDDTVIGERPQFEGAISFWYLVGGVALGTAALLFLIKLRMGRSIWKVWYALAVGVSIMIALGVLLSQEIAFLLAVLLTYVKLKRSNMFTHNITEILMYAGLAYLLVPIFDIFWSIILLIVISIYDAIAVWKSKHMVDLAKFTTESNLFAGLLVNYDTKKGKTKLVMEHKPAKIQSSKTASAKKATKKSTKKSTARQAILGGGDIVFPLIFSGSVLIWLLELGYTKFAAFGLAMIISLGATAALLYLFFTAKKDRYYPAMPFISGGCFLGFIILLTLIAF